MRAPKCIFLMFRWCCASLYTCFWTMNYLLFTDFQSHKRQTGDSFFCIITQSQSIFILTSVFYSHILIIPIPRMWCCDKQAFLSADNLERRHHWQALRGDCRNNPHAELSVNDLPSSIEYFPKAAYEAPSWIPSESGDSLGGRTASRQDSQRQAGRERCGAESGCQDVPDSLGGRKEGRDWLVQAHIPGCHGMPHQEWVMLVRESNSKYQCGYRTSRCP